VRNIIPIYHIWPGINYYKKEGIHWMQNYTDSMMKIFSNIQERVPIVVGAHTHWLDFQVYKLEAKKSNE